MLYSRNPHMTAVDRMWLLWVICLVAHFNKHQIPFTVRNTTDMFGEEVQSYIRFYMDWGIQGGYIDWTRLCVLTEKGQRTAKNWKRVQNKIMEPVTRNYWPEEQKKTAPGARSGRSRNVRQLFASDQS